MNLMDAVLSLLAVRLVALLPTGAVSVMMVRVVVAVSGLAVCRLPLLFGRLCGVVDGSVGASPLKYHNSFETGPLHFVPREFVSVSLSLSCVVLAWCEPPAWRCLPNRLAQPDFSPCSCASTNR